MINFKILKAVDEKYYKGMLNVIIQSPDQEQADNVENQILENKKNADEYISFKDIAICQVSNLKARNKQLKEKLEKIQNYLDNFEFDDEWNQTGTMSAEIEKILGKEK